MAVPAWAIIAIGPIAMLVIGVVCIVLRLSRRVAPVTAAVGLGGTFTIWLVVTRGTVNPFALAEAVVAIYFIAMIAWFVAIHFVLRPKVTRGFDVVPPR